MNVLISLALIYYGLQYSRIWQPIGLAFIIFAVLLLGCLALIFFRNLTKKFRLYNEGLVYKCGGRSYSIQWDQLKIFYPPKPSKKFFKTAVFGDSVDAFQIDSFAFPGFDEIIQEVKKMQKRGTPSQVRKYSLY
ncbi:MAG: hypothetical protein M1269_02785 [Chloroflexi bacterium]|nr:hypothetical protein [Chloroflexota bacterium]